MRISTEHAGKSRMRKRKHALKDCCWQRRRREHKMVRRASQNLAGPNQFGRSITSWEGWDNCDEKSDEKDSPDSRLPCRSEERKWETLADDGLAGDECNCSIPPIDDNDDSSSDGEPNVFFSCIVSINA